MEGLSALEPKRSKLEQMGESIVVAFDWALSLEDEIEQIELIEELHSYAAIEGELTNQEINELYKKALAEEE